MENSEEHATIRTELDNVAFVPGETLRGTVGWQVKDTPPAVTLRMFHYTEGRGTQDVEIIEEKIFDHPHSSGEEAFEFSLPAGPYSFSGKLVSLIWALELMIGESGLVERMVFVLSPTGEEINLYRHARDEMPEYASFQFGGGKKRRKAGR